MTHASSLTEVKSAPNSSANLQRIRPLAARHVGRILDLSGTEILSVLTLAESLRTNGYGEYSNSLAGKSLALVFEKPSLRTRVSFEIGFQKLGGNAIYLDQQHSPLGKRESLADFARTIERYVDVLAARVMSHETIAGLALSMTRPVVNALCDRHHPCQALADFQSLQSRVPDVSHSHIAWVGDGNNVCHSLIECAAALGSRVTVVTPKGLEPDNEVVAKANGRAMRTGATITLTSDLDAIAGADAIYADTWVSMGDSAEAAERKTAALRPYQVNARTMSIAGSRALFMHCLPAHRGEEVTNEVIDSPASIVFDQAECRMHAQASLLLHLFAH